MSTSILNCMVLLSKELGDYWSSTTTSSGSTTTVVDTELKAYPNSWIDSTANFVWDNNEGTAVDVNNKGKKDSRFRR